MSGAISSRRTSLICAAMLSIFAILSYAAALCKNATFDENIHLPAGFTHLRYSDFRMNPEHPPLWKYWQALPLLVSGPKIDFSDWTWKSSLEDITYQWNWAVDVLYRTPGNDADQMLAISRAMMLVLALALGVLIAKWSWKAGGSVAAVAAVSLFAFDPNFIAHSPLVTNDVSFSLVVFALMYATWCLGRRATWKNILAVMLLCSIGAVIKYTGVFFGFVLLLVLVARALMPQPWDVLGRTLATYRSRLAMALGTCVVTAFVAVGVIWATYQFRFRPTPDPSISLNMPGLVRLTESNELYSKHPGIPITPEERRNWRPSLLTRVVLFAESHHLLPQAFLFGLLHVHMAAVVRTAYLLGEISDTGWWYYFPLAMLFKTACATIVAFVLASWIAWQTRRRWWDSMEHRWLALCLGVPATVYLMLLMSSNLNLGLRHALPIYPLAYVAMGLVCAHAWRRWNGNVKWVATILAIGLAAETVAAFPDFIPFFNLPSYPHRFYLLGDSNLDWAQDLKPLSKWYRDWRSTHRKEKFYLCYFGIADPAYYGIDYVNIPGGYGLGPKPQMIDAPGVIAISATRLQAIYTPELKELYAPLREHKPLAIIGASIYLYQYPLERARR